MASSSRNKPGKQGIATGYTQGINFLFKKQPQKEGNLNR